MKTNKGVRDTVSRVTSSLNKRVEILEEEVDKLRWIKYYVIELIKLREKGIKRNEWIRTVEAWNEVYQACGIEIKRKKRGKL